jgi:hypothetical protein
MKYPKKQKNIFDNKIIDNCYHLLITIYKEKDFTDINGFNKFVVKNFSIDVSLIGIVTKHLLLQFEPTYVEEEHKLFEHVMKNKDNFNIWKNHFNVQMGGSNEKYKQKYEKYKQKYLKLKYNTILL